VVRTTSIPLVIMSATNTHGMMRLSKILLLLVTGSGVTTHSSRSKREHNTLSHRHLTHSPVGDEVNLNDCDSRVCAKLNTA